MYMYIMWTVNRCKYCNLITFKIWVIRGLKGARTSIRAGLERGLEVDHNEYMFYSGKPVL